MQQRGKITYRLNQPDHHEKKLYRFKDLEGMTTHQLREICREEKIIKGVINTLDRDSLLQEIMRYRGLGDEQLINIFESEGNDRLETLLAKSQLHHNSSEYRLDGSATITVYSGIATVFSDGITMAYDSNLAGTNALVVNNNRKVCGIFNVMPLGADKSRLYLVRNRQMVCMEATDSKNYSLYCFDQGTSAFLKSFYTGEVTLLPDHLMVYSMPILDFAIREPMPLTVSPAIDFGTTNTAAGVYIDSTYFENTQERLGARGLEPNTINYALFYDTTSETIDALVTVPSVVAVESLEGGIPKYAFGYDAVKLADSVYTDEGFAVFQDIKRWVTDFEKVEALTDRQGRHMLVSRKEILQAYFQYIIEQIQDRFKCTVPTLHISSPVKQQFLFQRLFEHILPEYTLEDALDEGVTVLYNALSETIAKKGFQDGIPQKALIIDCGGGTTDLSSCTYTVKDKRVSYDIHLQATYENGDTNFGGNNLTHRIMQLLKLQLAIRLGANISLAEIMQDFDTDIFRQVDEHGVDSVYKGLNDAYDIAEELLPTRFKNFEGANRADYFKVKANFYFFFRLAEQVKKVFYNRAGVLRIHLKSGEEMIRRHGQAPQSNRDESDTATIRLDKWKLSIRQKVHRSIYQDKRRGTTGISDIGQLETVKDVPSFFVSIYDIELLLKADIYGIVRQFFAPLYDSDSLYEYNTIKLSGQSCKIGIFADAIKEYLPGKLIQFKRPTRNSNNKNEQTSPDMKLNCVEGALQYLKDRKYGYANVTIKKGDPALPYEIIANNHRGERITLIHPLEKRHWQGSLSRNLDDLAIELYLHDASGVKRHSYTYSCSREDFQPITYEEIRKDYPNIQQSETDTITDGEAKFFVWASGEEWGFYVLSVTRVSEGLRIGKEQFFPFEHDTWVVNFFDGTH